MSSSGKPHRLIVATLMLERGDTGVQTHFNLIAQYAREAGLDVQVASPHRWNRSARRLAGLVTRLLRPVRREWAAVWYRWIDYLSLTRVLRECARSGASGEVVVYAQDPLSARAGLELRGQLPDLRVVMMAHYNVSEAHEQVMAGNAKENGFLVRRLLRNEREVLPRLDLLVFPSRFSLEQVKGRVPAIASVPLAVIRNFTAPPTRAERAHPMADIISIGTLEPRKNQAFLIRVLAEAYKRGHHYRLTLVGQGPGRGALEALSRELGVESHVRFLGRVDQAASLIPCHRVYAHAARVEAFGIVLIEAMSYGIPVLAPAVGGIPEIVSDGREGFYWSLEEPVAAAELLVRLLESPQTYARCCAEARATYERNYRADTMGREWLQAVMGRQLASQDAPAGLGLRGWADFNCRGRPSARS